MSNYNSITFNDSDDVSSVWLKYLALANDANCDGRLESRKPYSLEYISLVCMESRDEVKRIESILTGGDNPRLIIEADGTRVIAEWDKYKGHHI